MVRSLNLPSSRHAHGPCTSSTSVHLSPPLPPPLSPPLSRPLSRPLSPPLSPPPSPPLCVSAAWSFCVCSHQLTSFPSSSHRHRHRQRHLLGRMQPAMADHNCNLRSTTHPRSSRKHKYKQTHSHTNTGTAQTIAEAVVAAAIPPVSAAAPLSHHAAPRCLF